MYVMSAQYCDAQDLTKYLGPVIAVTGLSSFLGFMAASSLLANMDQLRNLTSLVAGFLGIMATTITALRNAAKFDVKAETFRGAAGQYRLLATRLEERMRTHRMLIADKENWAKPSVREAEIDNFNKFFENNYRIVLTAQSEMKYFPPGAVVSKWKSAKKLLPNEIDQPEVDRSKQLLLLKQHYPSVV
eukprot:CAMPEP_0172618000 /NCGR_PEP_ID=MMETSP1068-20121228/75802_1 /TAXON_ID=35684 /ORGANISM="Pseudopedinella elastica, Strain CCMP716" /LENGTH=187 /DNA_ID=CAMNT_0013423989 /DNA_START=21 /DNA_END=584 /DNA_ORIENTATION=-